MVGVAVAWGACFVAISWGLRDAPVLWFAALRALLAGAALVALGGAQHRRLPRGMRTWALIGLLGLVNATLALAAMFAAGAGAATGVAAVLANAQPLLILLPAWGLFGQRPARSTTIALLLGLAGLTVVASASGAGAGAGLSLAAAAATTAGTLLARWLRGIDVIVVAGWHLLLGGLALAVWATVSEGTPDIAWTGRFMASLAFLALVGTAATTVVWFTEAQHARLDQLTTWTLLVPVIGVLLAALVLGERPTGWTLLGLGAVLAALWIAQRPEHTPPAAHHGLPPTAPGPRAHQHAADVT
jgi:drug/metabolite transporter (DMT)-like permease